MPNILQCDGFQNSFPSLSGALPISASHADITRAMLVVGYPSLGSAIRNVGFWRTALLYSMMRGYLDASLCTTAYFRNLEQSEKATMSFLLGQAFTYWFAQNHMNVPYVVHVRGARQTWQRARTSVVLKNGAGPFKPRARPDFIGPSTGGYHVFESKGRSSRISNSVVSTALSQASMIATVNSQVPATRVAACFGFLANGVSGRVIDPAGAPEGLDLVFDDVAAAEKTYAFFLEPERREEASATLISDYLCVDLGEGFIYGVDPKVLAMLDDLRPLPDGRRTVEPLLELLEERRADYVERRSSSDSAGEEGIIFRSGLPPS